MYSFSNTLRVCTCQSAVTVIRYYVTGSHSDVTKHARRMAEVCNEELQKLETELEQLETEINPALDDNALVAFNYVLSKVVASMKHVPEVSAA